MGRACTKNQHEAAGAWVLLTVLTALSCTGTIGAGSGGAGPDRPTPGADGGAPPPVVDAPCDPSKYSGISLEEVKADFAARVHPRMLSPTQGCIGCHATNLGRIFEITADANATFQVAYERGLLKRAPGTIFGRILSADPTIRMPKGGDPWAAADVLALSEVTCKLAAYEQGACTASTIEPGPSPLRRLTAAEYDQTVADLLGTTLRPGTTFPAEAEGYGFDNNAEVSSVDEARALKIFDAAEALAASANLTVLAPCAAFATVPASCGSDFVASIGPRLFRRPLIAEDTARYVGLYQTNKPLYGAPVAIRMTLTAMLLSPHFLYRVELGSVGAPGAVVSLTQYELATRLSYLLWGSMPDEALFAAAAAGQLATKPQIEAQARRLLASPRAQAVVDNFHRQWLLLDLIDAVDKVDTRFPTLRPLMKTEAKLFISDVFWSGVPASTLFEGSYTFLNKPLATFYGATGPTSATFVKVPTDGSHRLGMLTQSSFLAAQAYSDQTDPIRRGKFVRERLLCEELSPPPPGLSVVPPPVDATSTTRNRFKSHSVDALCSTCHTRMDPVGFGFENYDALGAWRETDNGFPVDANGLVSQSADLDGAFHGAAELAHKLAGSPTVKACIVDNWFRYGNGRGEGAADSCSLKRLNDRFATSGYDLRELVVALTQSDAFLYRRVVAPGAAP